MLHNKQGCPSGNAMGKNAGSASSVIITLLLFLLSQQLSKSEQHQTPTNHTQWSGITEAKGQTVKLNTGSFIYRSPIKENSVHLKGAIQEIGSKALITSGPLQDKAANRYWIGIRKGGWLKLDDQLKEIKPGIWSLKDSKPYYSLKLEPLSGSQEALRLFPKEDWLLQGSSVLMQDETKWIYFSIEGYLIASENNTDYIETPGTIQKRPVKTAIIDPIENDLNSSLSETKPLEINENEYSQYNGIDASFHFHNGLLALQGYDEIVRRDSIAITIDTHWGLNHPTIIVGSNYRHRPEIFAAAKRLVDHAAAAQTAETGLPVVGTVQISGYQEQSIGGQTYQPSGSQLDSVIELKLYSVNYVENVQYWNSQLGLAKQWELVECFGETIGGDIYIFRPSEGLTEYDNPEIKIDKPIEKGEVKKRFSHYHLDREVFENPGGLTAIFVGANPVSIENEQPTFMGITPQSHPHVWPTIERNIKQGNSNEAQRIAWQALAASAAGEGFFSEIPVINEILVSVYHHRGSRGALEVLALFLDREGNLNELIKAFETRILQTSGWEQLWIEARQTQEWQYHVPRINAPPSEREKFRKGLEMRWATEAIFLSRATKQTGKLERE